MWVSVILYVVLKCITIVLQYAPMYTIGFWDFGKKALYMGTWVY